ncbi:unnamed protein product [Rhodiola kirilowii]
MVFSSMSNYNLNPTSNCWNHQQVNHHQLGSSSIEVHHPRPPYIPLPPPPPPSQQPPTTIHHQGIIRPGSMTDRARMANMPIPETVLKCPRCASMNTKFCYYNNYSLSQPRYFCKNCRRYWTQGGALRNVPVGGGCRRNKRSNSKGGGGGSSSTRTSKSPARSGSTPSNSSGCSSGHQIRPPVSFMAPLNHLSDYSIADIGANYPGVLVPHQMSSSAAEHFNLDLQGNVSNYTTSNSGMDPWRFINQQQLVQQYHHPTSFFDGNLEVPPRGSTPNLYAGLESSHVTVTASHESNKHKLLSPTGNSTAASIADHAQMDLLKLERNINICDTSGISSRGQLMSRPNYQHRSFTGLFQGDNAQIPQLNWIGASENRNINSNSNSASTAPTIAWTDLISGFSSSPSTTLRPS